MPMGCTIIGVEVVSPRDGGRSGVLPGVGVEAQPKMNPSAIAGKNRTKREEENTKRG